MAGSLVHIMSIMFLRVSMSARLIGLPTRSQYTLAAPAPHLVCQIVKSCHSNTDAAHVCSVLTSSQPMPSLGLGLTTLPALTPRRTPRRQFTSSIGTPATVQHMVQSSPASFCQQPGPVRAATADEHVRQRDASRRYAVRRRQDRCHRHHYHPGLTKTDRRDGEREESRLIMRFPRCAEKVHPRALAIFLPRQQASAVRTRQEPGTPQACHLRLRRAYSRCHTRLEPYASPATSCPPNRLKLSRGKRGPRCVTLSNLRELLPVLCPSQNASAPRLDPAPAASHPERSSGGNEERRAACALYPCIFMPVYHARGADRGEYARTELVGAPRDAPYNGVWRMARQRVVGLSVAVLYAFLAGICLQPGTQGAIDRAPATGPRRRSRSRTRGDVWKRTFAAAEHGMA
ncbi:hypothetical protein GY45DRAFT_970579 [Cubamyces sp. BRFM 1775]|nr:hypothetical protein GY45DRAFT_970579 [Cubamyces sp. BRFM 1775]